jgi:hypothetical protein
MTKDLNKAVDMVFEFIAEGWDFVDAVARVSKITGWSRANLTREYDKR